MKIETKHTPGPWIVRATMGSWAGDRAGEIQISADLGYVAMVLPRNEANLRNNSVIGWEVGSAESNAHLIAAAPDLLEALTHVVICKSFEDFQATLPTIRRAIAKASGGRSLA